MIEPRWFAHPATKPGYGDPEAVKPVHTCDPPEIIAICLDCPVSGGCRADLPACPLYSKVLSRKRRLAGDEFRAREEKIRDMIRVGWRDEAIYRELCISKRTLYKIKKRLRERGEIN